MSNAQLTKDEAAIRVRRYSEEVRRLEALLASRKRKVDKAKVRLADAKDRLALAKKGRQ